VAAERSVAFAPGRVNLIGEHTDYNQGLALPFAIAEGVTASAEAVTASAEAVTASAEAGDRAAGDHRRITACAQDLGEGDEFALPEPRRARGWRAFVRGTAAELGREGVSLPGARIEISGDVPPGAGLASSAALEVSLCLALLALAAGGAPREQTLLDRVAIARLCARVESDWVGVQTGLLDQLASLCGAPQTALRIDFQTLGIDSVPLRLDGWRLVVLDSGQRHDLASSGYNERRAECARACRLLGVESLREAAPGELARLPEPLRRRASHVLGENERVREAVAALQADDFPALGGLLNAAHESLRDRYEVSTPAIEATVERLREAGALGARLIGGGFGGSVLGLFQPTVAPPAAARTVLPSAGARVLGG
jgi:galactokinase